MGKRKIRLTDEMNYKPFISENAIVEIDMSMEEFLLLHEKFIHYKALEGLAQRTIDDHKKMMDYFKNYLLLDKRSMSDRYVNIDAFRGYLSYMLLEKGYKPCTVNIRLRTMKCYLRWLFDEKIIS